MPLPPPALVSIVSMSCAGSRLFRAVLTGCFACFASRIASTKRDLRQNGHTRCNLHWQLGNKETKTNRNKNSFKKGESHEEGTRNPGDRGVLVAAFPMTASAGNVKPGCGGIFFRPCPNTMPPAFTGGNSNGTRSGGGSSARLRHLHGPRLRRRLPHASPEPPAPGRRPLSPHTLPSLREPPDASRAVSFFQTRRSRPGPLRGDPLIRSTLDTRPAVDYVRSDEPASRRRRQPRDRTGTPAHSRTWLASWDRTRKRACAAEDLSAASPPTAPGSRAPNASGGSSGRSSKAA